MKKYLEIIKTWFENAWLVVKEWFKKNWLMIINYVVLLIAYSVIYGKPGMLFVEVLLGLWIFVSAAYGMYLIFKR